VQPVTGVGKDGGRPCDVPRKLLKAILRLEKVSVVIGATSSPAVIDGTGGGDDRGEKGNVSIAIDGLLCIDCGTSWSDVDIAEVSRLGKVEGHSTMIGTVVLLTEVGVFKGVSVSGVDRSV